MAQRETEDREQQLVALYLNGIALTDKAPTIR